MEIQKQLMDEILSRFMDIYKPIEIYLYSSYTLGSSTEDSDVDLCLILKDSENYQADRIRDGLRALKEIPVPLDLLVFTEQEIEDRKYHPSSLIFKICHMQKKLNDAI